QTPGQGGAASIVEAALGQVSALVGDDLAFQALEPVLLLQGVRTVVAEVPAPGDADRIQVEAVLQGHIDARGFQARDVELPLGQGGNLAVVGVAADVGAEGIDGDRQVAVVALNENVLVG